MKATTLLGAGANLAVIALVGFYLWNTRGPSADSAPARGRPVPIDLAEEEWLMLVKGGARLGTDGATPYVVGFLDYECPFCQSSHRLVERFIRGSPDKAVTIRHFPLRSHPAAELAARAAICAESQGAFERVH